MIALFVIGSSTIVVMILLVVAVGLARAPEGYEDADGFHHGKCPEPPRVRRSQRRRDLPTDARAPAEPDKPVILAIGDAIVSVRKEVGGSAKSSGRKPSTKSVVASKKLRAAAEDEITPNFQSSGGTAVSDSIPPFSLPGSATDGDSADTSH